ncbi:serine/threonine protein kinase [Persicitalea sp.]|uniref:serine/threonine protein kinase n=1 Tax=Persicitalea sp. TaxID=3100273 RepID=UPI0035943330
MSTIRFDTRFPGYEVLSELGRSNARILKARHLATGDLVAIKHFALNTDSETLRRFERESAIMASIAQPNIVKVREVRLEAELPYIVMELIEGGNLRQLIAGQQTIAVPTTIRLGLQMASAFKAIHPQGIIHRDVKPENILYRPMPSGELHFLLTDFGVARLHEQSNTLTGQSLMTYEYASPEQFNDPKAVGIASDYYSLGVVLYECLHGNVPFSLDDQSGIVTFMNKVLSEAPPALAIMERGQSLDSFTDLLRGLLQKKTADRLSDPDELIWHLKQAELNYLQSTRESLTNPASPPPAALRQPPTDAEPTNTDLPGPRLPRSQKPRRAMPSGLKLSVLAFAVLLGIFGLYYAYNAVDNSKPIDGATPVEVPMTTDSTVSQVNQLEQAKLRRDQLHQEAMAAAKKLSVRVKDLKVGLLGGIKNVELRLSNPSSVTFSSVAVQVNYYKEKGGLYSSEKVYFSPVGPNSSLTRKAPNSNRGTRLTTRIVNYRFSGELDSLMNITTLDSLD